MQAINPFLILVLVPFFSYVVYPLVGRVVTLTPLRKIAAGFFLTFLSFLIIASLQRSIDQGGTPTVHWQFLAYLIITAGEVLVSVTCLEHAYTQAPHEVKSFVMALYLLSVSVGNFLTAGINKLITYPAIGQHLKGWNYFLFFGGLLWFAAVFGH